MARHHLTWPGLAALLAASCLNQKITVRHEVPFFFFSLLGLHLWHMEDPRLGVELELQLPAYATATAMPDWIRAASETYTAAHGNTGYLTH